MSSLKFDQSFKTEVSVNHSFFSLHRYFSQPENIEHKPATHCSSLKFDADDEFSAENETLQVN